MKQRITIMKLPEVQKSALVERLYQMRVPPIDYSLPENRYAEQGKDVVGYNRAIDDVLKVLTEI